MVYNTRRAVDFSMPLLVAITAGLTLASASPQAQEQPARPGAKVKTVWDGVYTAEQAEHGRDAYAEHCSHCHTTAEAPMIVGDRFLRRYFEDDLSVPFVKMRTDMPQDLPGTLSDQMYADILAYLLQTGEFPTGTQALPGDDKVLAGILVTGKEGPGGPVPNFSLVQVVGCLTEAGGTWTVTNGTRPVRARDPGNSPEAEVQALAKSPLGTNTLELMSVLPQHRDFKGHKVQAKGLLNRTPTMERINVTTMQSVAPTCTP
jgi:quinoprotein glucose dehydrogenase